MEPPTTAEGQTKSSVSGASGTNREFIPMLVCNAILLAGSGILVFTLASTQALAVRSLQNAGAALPGITNLALRNTWIVYAPIVLVMILMGLTVMRQLLDWRRWAVVVALIVFSQCAIASLWIAALILPFANMR